MATQAHAAIAPTYALKAQSLHWSYPSSKTPAVNDASLNVAAGTIVGLLGPNGAGKTTTVKLLTTLFPLQSGEIDICGVDAAREPSRARGLIGVVAQNENLDQSLRVIENLEFHAAYFGVPRRQRREMAQALLDEFGLQDKAKSAIRTLSGGMRKRLMIARAVMHAPRVLILDEPTSGLDPQSRLYLWQRLRALRARGTAILLATHDMHEAEELSDQVAIVDHGRVLVCDSPQNLKHDLPGDRSLYLEIKPASGEGLQHELLDRLKALDGVMRAEPIGQQSEGESDELLRLQLLVGKQADLLQAVIDTCTQQGFQLNNMRLSEPSLEDIFIHLTGSNPRG